MTFTPKWRFDLVLAVIIAAWFGLGRLLFRGVDIDVFLVQGSAILPFLFLSPAISRGPLARLWRPATHFIYNRRHLGVTTWGLAVFHAACVVHCGNSWKPANLLEVLPGPKLLAGPFTLFGVAALLILTVMALASWDYFLHAWGAPGWKRLHMAVYVAYGFVAIHFLARFLGDPPVARRPLAAFIGVAAVVAVLHLAAPVKEGPGGRPAPPAGGGPIPLRTLPELPPR